ncbi:hypothetical protein AB1Y20_012755 [Prymnesium parvum]|uniref:Uncharacterized protein n=1 Tax=Prymnesium parvum TaxID=97485 RepID=A0AB34IMC4_PRYPA|mmetsp:Transcript_15352/g.36842  ORF Transcript_15352/g.36842 Transcript_15352/m.36842 type:complete len:191 (-) Transcript_15352:52-624(-)
MPRGSKSAQPPPPSGWLCFNCKGSSRKRRASKNSRSCTAYACKKALRKRRLEQGAQLPEASLITQPAPRLTGERMPRNMYVQELRQILGERCCLPSEMSNFCRRNGPYNGGQQEFLVRGYFMEVDTRQDVDTLELRSAEEADPVGELNLLWVHVDDLSATICKSDIQAALLDRLQCVNNVVAELHSDDDE